jgi:hypothetical protein
MTVKTPREDGEDAVDSITVRRWLDRKAPRSQEMKVGSEDLAHLSIGVSLETFGALDIVFNGITGELVLGRQRIVALKAVGTGDGHISAAQPLHTRRPSSP